MPADARRPDRRTKLLPEPAAATATAASAAGTASAPRVVEAKSRPADAVVSAAGGPARQLSELPKPELETLAAEFGLDTGKFAQPADLIAAIHARRQLIAATDRDALADVVRWGRRLAPPNATKEQLAQEVARCRSMRFAGLSQRGLVALARLRGVGCADDDPVPDLIKKLKKKEGFFARLNRQRRAMIASAVSNLIGESVVADNEYRFLPGGASGGGPGGRTATDAAAAGIKEEIEDAGLIGGITNRLKRSADSYLNQKLDEIEGRIDRKLDEIDRRLAEWRDKEVANRIKILKITLWASVIVGVVSLVYSYVVVNLYPAARGVPQPPPPPRRPPAAVIAPPVGPAAQMPAATVPAVIDDPLLYGPPKPTGTATRPAR